MTDEARWKQTLDHLRLQMTRATFDMQLQRTRLIGRKGQVLTIKAPNQRAQEWLQHRMQNTIQRAASFIWQEPLEVKFQAD